MKLLVPFVLIAWASCAEASNSVNAHVFKKTLTGRNRPIGLFCVATFFGDLVELNNDGERRNVKMQEKSTAAVIRASTETLNIDSPYFYILSNTSGAFTVAPKKKLPKTIGLIGFDEKLDETCEDMACADSETTNSLSHICVVHSPVVTKITGLKDSARELVNNTLVQPSALLRGSFIVCLEADRSVTIDYPLSSYETLKSDDLVSSSPLPGHLNSDDANLSNQSTDSSSSSRSKRLRLDFILCKEDEKSGSPRSDT